MFAGEGAGLIVIERTHDEAAAERLVPLSGLEAAVPVIPLPPLEMLSQTYWFKANAPLPAHPREGILDTTSWSRPTPLIYRRLHGLGCPRGGPRYRALVPSARHP